MNALNDRKQHGLKKSFLPLQCLKKELDRFRNMPEVIEEHGSIFSQHNTIADLSSTSHWFKFLAYSFRLSGAEVDYSKLNSQEHRNKRHRYILLAWGLTLWLLAVVGGLLLGVRIYYEIVLKEVASSDKNPHALAFVGSILVEYFCTNLVAFGAHAAILVTCSRLSWTALWEKLHIFIQSSNSNNIVEDVKKMALFASLYLIAVSEHL